MQCRLDFFLFTIFFTWDNYMAVTVRKSRLGMYFYFYPSVGRCQKFLKVKLLRHLERIYGLKVLVLLVSLAS